MWQWDHGVQLSTWLDVIVGYKYEVIVELSAEARADMETNYIRRVGSRLRTIRRQKRMSLQEVEARSEKEFKASVLGAYERGERAISVPRLQRLASFYNVPVDQLLPTNEEDFGVNEAAVVDIAGRPRRRGPVTIDLARLERLTGPEADMLTRYLTTIQVHRQDFNGRMLTVRLDDLRAIACILGVRPDGAVGRLSDLGLAYSR